VNNVTLLSKPPALADAVANYRALRSWIVETPAVCWPRSVEACTAEELWLKLELFQVTGTFKSRGALSVIRHLTPEQRARGVVTASAGNHAIAVGYGARQFGCSARVYMARSADPYRIERARAAGADVRLVDDHHVGFAAARSDEATEGRYFVHPFEGPWTTLGTASLALELQQQLPPDVDIFVAALGGGGLVSGLAPTIKALRPRAQVIGIEPTGAPTLSGSLAAGRPTTVDRVETIADSLAPPFAEPYSFALVRDYVDAVLLVEDENIRAAMRLLLERWKLLVEPAGATALAGVLTFPERFAGRKVCAMVCGSNIGLARYAQIMGTLIL